MNDGDAIINMSSDASAYITGQEFVEDGGRSAGYSFGALEKLLA